MTVGAFVVRHRTAILGTTALLAAAGAIAAARLPVSIFPEVAFHRITLIARVPNLPVELTVTSLTQPLENAMASVPDVQTIRSTTTRGGTQLDLLFGWDTEMVTALTTVQAAMEEARGVLPADADLDARLVDTSAFPIIGVAVSSPQHTLGELSDFAIYDAAPQLKTIPGVFRVDLEGAKVREYALVVDPAALAAHHLDLAAVEAAVRSATTVAAAGQARNAHQLTLTVVRSAREGPQGVLDVVVAKDGATPVTLGTVAHIEPGVREDFVRTAADGVGAVLMGISRRPTGNSVMISRAVQARVRDLQRAHPDYRFSIFYDQADLVQAAVANVRDCIGIGLLLALAMLYLFLGDWRATALAAAVIPATLLITCVALYALGQSFNLMTLGGIAAGIGLILDDAIVVIERISRHALAGTRGEDGVRTSLDEIARALFGSTLTPVSVLLPLGLLGGVPGAFFRPLALTMSVALLVSLGLALTFTPALAIAVGSGHVRHAGPGERLAVSLNRVYGRALHFTLRHRWVGLGIGLALVALTVVAAREVETGFVPEMDEGAFVLDYWAPPGTALDETERMLAEVDDVLRATPEIAGFSRRTGAEMGFFLTETNRGDYSVRLRDKPRRSIGRVIEDVRDRLEARVPGLRVEFIQVLQDMIGDLSGNPSPIEIKLFGADPVTARPVAEEAARRIGAVRGVADEFAGITEVGPTYDVLVDPRRAALAGLDAGTVQHWLETAITGTVVGSVLERQRAIPLRLRYPQTFRDRLDTLKGVTLSTPQGGLAPLEAVAELRDGPVTVQRDREDLRPLVRVTAHLSGRALGSTMRDVRRALESLVLPAGVTLVYGGLYASQQRAFTELSIVFAGSVACISAVLLIEFGTLAAAFAIVAGSAVALAGSLTALWATHTALNVSSIVGMIMVVGIVSKNGILLLDRAVRTTAHGADLEAALVEAARVRLRPILMTSLAAAAGLAPLAAGIGTGAEMQQPLAIAILGGMALSMLCSLIAVPLLYCVLVRRHATSLEVEHAPAGS